MMQTSQKLKITTPANENQADFALFTSVLEFTRVYTRVYLHGSSAGEC